MFLCGIFLFAYLLPSSALEVHLTLDFFATVFCVGHIQGEWQQYKGRMEPIRKPTVKEAHLTPHKFCYQEKTTTLKKHIYHYTSKFTFYVHHRFLRSKKYQSFDPQLS